MYLSLIRKTITHQTQSSQQTIPDIRAKILNNFLGLVDVAARFVVSKDENGKDKRGFILQPTQNVYAKNRLDGRKGALVSELVVKEDGQED